jgi:glycerophosphoryl diester phosphodiesterase
MAETQSPTCRPSLYQQNVAGFIVIAHRGASFSYPENTMMAFQKAYEMKADMIELDIQLSKDGVPVIYHDTLLESKTNGKGLVNRLSVNELQKLDAGSWFDKKFRGLQIPTLEEVLNWAKDKVSVNIEIKKEASEAGSNNEAEKKVIDTIRQSGMQKHVLVSSFSYKSVQRIKELDPQLATGLLFDKSSNKKSPADLVHTYRADSFNCKWRELKKSWRTELQQKGIPVYVYTVNHPFWMKRMIRLEISGIFTDKPDVLREIVLNHFSK